MDFKVEMERLGRQAKAAARQLALLTSEQKNAALLAIANALAAAEAPILAANARDLAAAEANGLTAAMIDRLRLTPARLAAIARSLRELVDLPDPVGVQDRTFSLPNGIAARRIRVPIGVIGIIFESRPNVTVDAGVLCLKAGNATILRGGKEAIHSNTALAEAMAAGCAAAGVNPHAIQLVPWTDREALPAMLKLNGLIDLVIPRGGEGLIRFVSETATVPVIKHYKGVCAIYVDREADADMAVRILENAKCQRPGVCNAAETLLIHVDALAAIGPKLADMLRRNGVEMRGDERWRALVPDAKVATEADWSEEFLDLIIAVRVVDSLEAAVEHITTYGSSHSDAIITEDLAAGETFVRLVDSAAVYINASTRFTDGGQFGMGAEIGISTDRIHARGPMGLEELTTYKYVLRGTGQVR